MPRTRLHGSRSAGVAAGIALAALATSALADPPRFLSSEVQVQHYPADNDLLTAGLGWAGIASAAPPATGNPPTADELRRLAIYNNWRGLISTAPAQGYGTVYGTLGPVPGTEYLAFMGRTPAGPAAALLVQIPDDFDRDRPCIVTAPSSGSRGVYGAISNAEVAFKNRCAVAYTDKGTGVGFHDLTADIVFDLRGEARPAGSVQAHFQVPDSPALQAYESAYPNRIAIKHAHSQTNPERRWGTFVLRSIDFALWALNDRFPNRRQAFSAESVTVIAAGVSNGGGAALLAAEQDRRGLVDGVVVSEPQVQPKPRRSFAIAYRGETLEAHSRSLYDVVTFMDVYADCAGASLNPVTPSSPGALRCAALKQKGLLTASTLAEQVQEARDRIHAHGLLPDADPLLAAHANLHLWRILAPVYGNAYARALVADHLCDVSFAATAADGTPSPWNPADRQKAFATLGGLPSANPVAAAGTAVQIIDDRATPPRNELLSPDLTLDAALCWRALATSRPLPTDRLPPAAAMAALRVGIAQVRAEARLDGRPAIMLHGRKDALIAPNHSSRPYFGLNRMTEGRRSGLRYIEVANGNHFDAFIPLYPVLGAVDPSLIAMHGYFNAMVEQMLAHLRGGAALPDSQVFTGSDETCAIPLEPVPQNRIRFRDRTLHIPVGVEAPCG